MRLFKRLFLIIFILVAVVVGGLAIFIATFDANHYKPQIINVVKKQTGRELVIDGDIKLSVYPDIAIDLKRTTLANIPGFGAKHLAEVDSAQISVKFLPLLKKQLKVADVRLKGLKLNLHRKADGKTNWGDLAKSKTKKPDVEKQASEIAEELMTNLSIAGVSLQDAYINWRDEQSGQNITLSPLNLKTGRFRPGKPLAVSLSLTLKQASPKLMLQAEGNTTVTLGKDKQSFRLADLNLQTKLTGSPVPNGALNTNISGNVKGSTKSVSIPNLKLHTRITGDLMPGGDILADFSGNTQFDVNTRKVTVSGMKLAAKLQGKPLSGGKLNANITGNASYNIGAQKLLIEGMNLDSNLAGGLIKKGTANAKMTGNVDLDVASQILRFQKMKLDGSVSGELVQNGTAKANISGKTRFNLAKQLLSIEGMDVNASLTGALLKGGQANTHLSGNTQVNLAGTHLKISNFKVDSTLTGGQVPGGKLKQQGQGNIDLNWGKKSGAVNLVSFLISLADLQLKGTNVQIHPLAAKPSVAGQFQTNTFNLKQALNVLGITPPVTRKQDALSTAQAQFKLKATTDSAELDKLKLKLDKSSITGKLAINNFASPSIGTQISIDRINVDDYLAPAAPKGSVKSGTDSSSPAKAELMPLDTLRKLNIDGSLKIGAMVINKLRLSDITAKIKANKGLINLDPANASLYKGRYKGRIKLDARKAIPTLNMRHELSGLRSEGLLFDLFADRYVSGNTVLVSELSSRGNSLDELLASLSGETRMEFRDGTIRDSNFAKQTALATRLFEKKKTKGGASVVTFTKLKGDWKAKNGVFQTNNLSMIAPYFQISGKGKADIAKQTADLHLRIGPKSKPGEQALFAPLRIYGSFNNLKYKLELDELIKSLATADLKKKEKEIREKLQKEKARLQSELEAKKQEEIQRLKAFKDKKAQELKQRLQAEKEKALKGLNEKTRGQIGDKLKEQVGDPGVKDLEDKVKDKLKDTLKGLF